MPIVDKQSYSLHGGYDVTVIQRTVGVDPEVDFAFDIIVLKKSTGTERKASFYLERKYVKDLAIIVALAGEYTSMVIRNIEKIDKNLYGNNTQNK